jgi:DNA-binding NarL/FixJ family response regulator
MITEKKYNRHQIYGILKDYHWKMREIQRLDRELKRTDFQGVAQYGIEATLPHAVGIVSQAIENEIVRREKKSVSMVEYAKEITFINDRLDRITHAKEKTVLDCLLDGMGIVAISHHLGMTRQTVAEIRDKIVEKLAD